MTLINVWKRLNMDWILEEVIAFRERTINNYVINIIIFIRN